MAEKKKPKKIYDQKFSMKWLEDPELQPWIEPPSELGYTAFCKCCNRNLKGSKTLMQRHNRNPKHIVALEKGGLPRVKINIKLENRCKPSLPKKWLCDALLASWIEPSEDPFFRAHCKECKVGLNGGLKNMYKHILTPTHQSFNKDTQPYNCVTIVSKNDLMEIDEMKFDTEESVIKVQVLEVKNALEASKYCEAQSFSPQREDNGQCEDQVEEEGEEIEQDCVETVEYQEMAPMQTSDVVSEDVKGSADPLLEPWVEQSIDSNGSSFSCKWCKCFIGTDGKSLLEHSVTSVHRTNSKINKRFKHYDQKFNPDWLEDPLLRSWIAPSSSKTAFCTKCNRHLQGSKTLMYRHAQNPRHTKSVLVAPNDDSVKAALRLSAFVAEHDLPLELMHNLPGLFKSIVKDNDTLMTTHCDPTKTEFLIKNVLAIDRLNDLSNKLVNTVFSVIVDESCDIYSKKSIALVVRYYDEVSHSVEDSFLTIIDVVEPSNSFKSIVDFFTSINVPLSNLIGFAADNCNSLVGKYSEVQVKLLQLVPFMYVSGFVVNSLQMCVSKAVSKLPEAYEKLCLDIYDYMYFKPQQVAGFEQIYSLFNVETHESVKVSNARWLSTSDVVTKIVEHWDTLLSYFSICSTDEQDSKAQQVLLTLTDPMCKLIFLFLNFFLPTVDDLTLEFQSSKYFVNSLLSSIEEKIKMILKFYMKSAYVNETSVADVDPLLECQFLLLENMYFGARVDAYLSSLDPTAYEIVLHFKGHSLNFYMEFCTQILERVNFRDSVVKYLYILNPEICKSDLYLSVRHLAMLFPNVIGVDTLDQLEAEWWEVKSSAAQCSNDEFFVFWNKVIEQNKYPCMVKFIKAMLCLPHSSESIVNTFTAIRRNNLKLRRKHDSGMMSSLLLVREKLKGTSSSDFEISSALLCLANSYNEKS